MSNTYLSFIVCGELYAVNVINVLEVLQKTHITPVPNAPEYIRGIINFRGDVVPVFESRLKLNLPLRPPGDPYVVIVFDLSQGTDVFRIGTIVDRVKDVINIEDNEIKPVPLMSHNFNTEFLKGVVKQNNNSFIMLLDIEKVLTCEELEDIKAGHLQQSTLINNN